MMQDAQCCAQRIYETKYMPFAGEDSAVIIRATPHNGFPSASSSLPLEEGFQKTQSQVSYVVDMKFGVHAR